jgi:hypothetical protein
MTVGTLHRDGVCWTVLSDWASRAMAYVGMTRGRDENHLAIYQAVTNEADQSRHDPDERTHKMCRGTTRAAAHALHAIVVANDARPRTMHSVAARTDPRLLPDIVAALVDRNERRRAQRARAWRREGAQTRARQAAYQRLATARQPAGCA